MSMVVKEFDPAVESIDAGIGAVLGSDPNLRLVNLSHTVDANGKVVPIGIFVTVDDPILTRNFQYASPNLPTPPGGTIILSGVSSLRIINSGQTAITSGSTVQLTTFSRNTGEVVNAVLFGSAKSGTYILSNTKGAPGGDDVNWRLVKTTSVDEMQLEVANGSGDVTIDFAIFGFVPD